MQPMSPRTVPVKPAKRTYDSSRRRRQAAETRAEVLTAAITLFQESGWAGTTVAAIADAAGVAVETIYSGFGSKKALLREAAEAPVAGDAEPVPYIDRPEFAQLGVGPVAERIRAGVKIVADTNERLAGVWRAVREAAEREQEIAAWLIEADERRRLDVRRSLERLFDRKVAGPMLDVLWVLFSTDAYRSLVDELGYSREQYE